MLLLSLHNMEALFKRILEKEFEANEIQMGIRVYAYASENNQIVTYAGECLLGGRKIMTLRIDATPPFETKISTVTFMEPGKLRHYVEIIEEATRSFHRLADQED